MIDGLVSKIRGSDHAFMGKIVGGLAINAMTPASHPAPCQLEIESGIDRIVRDLARRIRVRGDANYCICRILLEAMKPETGWGYHSLSDTVMACDAAINLVYDVQREQKLEDFQVADAVSVLGDVVTEIERRLLGPYEDTAILKNGDLACFANESFSLKPLGLGLSVAGASSGRVNCGGACGCGCDPESDPEDKPIFDAFDLSVMKGECPPPLVTEALTQEQCDAVDQERKDHERAE
jgi:hypothetical protein